MSRIVATRRAGAVCVLAACVAIPACNTQVPTGAAGFPPILSNGGIVVEGPWIISATESGDVRGCLNIASLLVNQWDTGCDASLEPVVFSSLSNLSAQQILWVVVVDEPGGRIVNNFTLTVEGNTLVGELRRRTESGGAISAEQVTLSRPQGNS